MLAALASRMETLAKEGVIFAACNKTMKRKGLTRADSRASACLRTQGGAPNHDFW